MPVQDQIGDGLGVPRRPEDFAVVAPQQAEIAVEVGGVLLQIVPDAEFRAEEGAAWLRPGASLRPFSRPRCYSLIFIIL